MRQLVTIALLGAGGPVAVVATVLTLNFRLFNSLVRRIEVVESDPKNFFRE